MATSHNRYVLPPLSEAIPLECQFLGIMYRESAVVRGFCLQVFHRHPVGTLSEQKAELDGPLACSIRALGYTRQLLLFLLHLSVVMKHKNRRIPNSAPDS